MSAPQSPIANPVVVLREEFDDWAILYNPETAEAVGTNPVGVAIWKQMDGRRSIDAICDGIRESFDETPETVKDDIAAFIRDLADRGFLGYEMDLP